MIHTCRESWDLTTLGLGWALGSSWGQPRATGPAPPLHRRVAPPCPAGPSAQPLPDAHQPFRLTQPRRGVGRPQVMDRTAGKELALVRGPGVSDPTSLATLRSRNARSLLFGPYFPANRTLPTRPGVPTLGLPAPAPAQWLVPLKALSSSTGGDRDRLREAGPWDVPRSHSMQGRGGGCLRPRDPAPSLAESDREGGMVLEGPA